MSNSVEVRTFFARFDGAPMTMGVADYAKYATSLHFLHVDIYFFAMTLHTLRSQLDIH